MDTSRAATLSLRIDAAHFVGLGQDSGVVIGVNCLKYRLLEYRRPIDTETVLGTCLTLQ
jgi:hypothetical protein